MGSKEARDLRVCEKLHISLSTNSNIAVNHHQRPRGQLLKFSFQVAPEKESWI